jgi:hypothetical protein
VGYLQVVQHLRLRSAQAQAMPEDHPQLLQVLQVQVQVLALVQVLVPVLQQLRVVLRQGCSRTRCTRPDKTCGP